MISAAALIYAWFKMTLAEVYGFFTGCNKWDLLKPMTCIFSLLFTRVHATEVSPGTNSLLQWTTTAGRVRPWDLWQVMVYMATTGYCFLEPTKRPLVRRLFHVSLFRPILPAILGMSTMTVLKTFLMFHSSDHQLTFHNTMTLHPGYRRMVLFAWHCIPMVSPSSVASNLRNSPGTLCMISLLWNCTLT